MSETNGKPRKQDAEPNQRRRLPEWLAVRLDLPPDILSGGMRAELRGRNLLTVQGCRRILTYTPTCIRLQMKDTVLAVRGRRLGCTSYLAGAVGVDGLVVSLSFEDWGGARCADRLAVRRRFWSFAAVRAVRILIFLVRMYSFPYR